MVSQDHAPTTCAATPKSAATKAEVAGHDTLRRIRAYIEDGDADAHDSLRNDVERLYNLMIRWRGTAQRWTPGGSEYMDPAYCERFIAERREDAHHTKVALTLLRRTLTLAHDVCLSTAPKQAVGEILATALSANASPPPTPEDTGL